MYPNTLRASVLFCARYKKDASRRFDDATGLYRSRKRREKVEDNTEAAESDEKDAMNE